MVLNDPVYPYLWKMAYFWILKTDIFEVWKLQKLPKMSLKKKFAENFHKGNEQIPFWKVVLNDPVYP